jgi:glutamate 5-kinase
MQKPVLVIKLGTAVLTNDKGEIVQATIKKVAAGIAELSLHRGRWYS